MASSKYERELRFIATESKRIQAELDGLREVLPDTPLDAEKKAMDIGDLEEKLGQLLTRKKEIEDSYIAAGLEVPNLNRSMNENGCRDSVADSDYVRPSETVEEVKPSFSEEELTDQIKNITDELMQIEIKMLKADIDDDKGEKQKLSMCAASLRSRREYLVGQMKALRTVAKEEEAAPASDERIESLEADTRALRAQVSDLRSDMTDIKEQLRQILEALRLE